MSESLSVWVLSLLVSMQPKAPWRDTYERTAQAIAKVSIESPLFGGEDGPMRTAAIMSSVAWFESTLKPDAAGDCADRKADGTCKPGGTPRSFCLFQIHESNFSALGVTRAQIQSDVDTCARAAIRMMHASFSVCRDQPVEDRLGQYASGGETCAGLAASRSRIRKGMWLFRSKRPS